MTLQKTPKEEKTKAILLGIIELYLLYGKPIGSNTLKENGFDHISSATIRNYFAKLESQGFLTQQHTSGGRIPTSLAYKFYASYYRHATTAHIQDVKILKKTLNQDTKEIARYLEQASELLSQVTQSAIFLSFPRFDQDHIVKIKLVKIDHHRYLCVFITDFGLIQTEILYAGKNLSHLSLKRLEHYFHFRMTGIDPPKLSKEEEDIALDFYREILLRYIVNYSNFSQEDIYKTGFSKLLQFPEFQDTTVLATGFSLFEDISYMRKLLQECISAKDLCFWIGNDLEKGGTHASVIAFPYFIHRKSVGAIALLGPMRMPYPKFFGLLRTFSSILSETLTRNLYKYKITYRKPQTKQIDLKKSDLLYLSQSDHLLLEDQSLRRIHGQAKSK